MIETSDYLLGFVELDDLGWFWDRQQMQAVVKAVRQAARDQARESGSWGGVEP